MRLPKPILGLLLASAVALSPLVPAGTSSPANLCKNPGFELLNPAGNNFPLNWSPVKSAAGQTSAGIDQRATEGRIALLLSADAAGQSGANGEPIPIRRGEARFHYQALQSGNGGENLVLYVIALGADGAEVPGRTTFKVPAAHVGDGQWHTQRIEFDYTANPAVTGILIGPRVNEATSAAEGAWLLDDFVCLESALGPRAQVETIHLADGVLLTGKPSLLVAQVANTGDQPLPASVLKLKLPAGFGVRAGEATEIPLGGLAPREWRRVSWHITASEPAQARLDLDWRGDGFTVGQSRPVWSVTRRDPRAECTDSNGFWRPMPALTSLQDGNAAPLRPLKPRKSAQLPDSFIGVTAHLPRSRDFERVFEPEHLLDGDPQTSWSGRGYANAVPGPVDWAEVRWPSQQTIRGIRLIPYHRAEGFPVDFQVKLRTGKSWTVVHEARGATLPATAGTSPKQPYVISLSSPVTANAVRLEATRLHTAASLPTDCATSHFLRLSEIEVISTAGDNVALATRGGRADAAFTFRWYYNSPAVIRQTYPELFNLGVKWNRISQWGDWTAWSMVEQRKGEYRIDPITDRAITDSVRNGVQILYTLCYGNALYEETPWLADFGPVWRHGHPFTGDGGPTKPETIQAFVNYARFVARQFKGRVKYYEIWNEQNSWAWYGSPPDAAAYGQLLLQTARALKEVDPEIKVCVGGTAELAPEWIAQALEAGAGPHLDAIAFHPYTMTYPEMGLGALDVVAGKQAWKSKEELGFQTYPEMLAFLRQRFAPYRADFEIWANEWNAGPTRELSPYRGNSEIVEAKQAARFFLVNTLCGVRAVWWSLVNENTGLDWGILRTGDLSHKPIYYTIQALTTLLSGARPDASIVATTDPPVPELRCEPLRGRDGDIRVALWSAVPPRDDVEAQPVTLRVRVASPRTSKAEAVDTLRARVQRLKVERDGSDLVIRSLLVTDCPLIVRL
jgi:hypothetical protein